MLSFKATSLFRRDYKRAVRRGCDMTRLEAVVDTLLAEQPLPEKNRDHALSGDYAGYRECHVLPDWLLIYRVDHDTLILLAARTGTHADLFDQ